MWYVLFTYMLLNVIRFEQEQGGTFNEGIQLEQGNRQMLPSAFELETEKDFTDGENIVFPS